MIQRPHCKIELGVFAYEFQFDTMEELDAHMARFKHDALSTCVMLLPVIKAGIPAEVLNPPALPIVVPSAVVSTGEPSVMPSALSAAPIEVIERKAREKKPYVGPNWKCNHCNRDNLRGIHAIIIHNFCIHKGLPYSGQPVTDGPNGSSDVAVIGMLPERQPNFQSMFGQRGLNITFFANDALQEGKWEETVKTAKHVVAMKWCREWIHALQKFQLGNKLIIAADTTEAEERLHAVLLP